VSKDNKGVSVMLMLNELHDINEDMKRAVNSKRYTIKSDSEKRAFKELGLDQALNKLRKYLYGNSDNGRYQNGQISWQVGDGSKVYEWIKSDTRKYDELMDTMDMEYNIIRRSIIFGDTVIDSVKAFQEKFLRMIEDLK
jgi:hypothetical protein